MRPSTLSTQVDANGCNLKSTPMAKVNANSRNLKSTPVAKVDANGRTQPHSGGTSRC
jgi:hypothetical protein